MYIVRAHVYVCVCACVCACVSACVGVCVCMMCVCINMTYASARARHALQKNIHDRVN